MGFVKGFPKRENREIEEKIFHPFYSTQRGSGGNAKKIIIHLVALAGCEPWRTSCVVRLMNLVFFPPVLLIYCLWIKEIIFLTKILVNPYKHWVFCKKHPLKSPYIIYILGRNERMRNLSKPL